MQLIVKKQKSNKNQNIYYALTINLGYATRYISFDKTLCMELLEKTPRELEKLPLGDYIIIEKGDNNV